MLTLGANLTQNGVQSMLVLRMQQFPHYRAMLGSQSLIVTGIFAADLRAIRENERDSLRGKSLTLYTGGVSPQLTR